MNIDHQGVIDRLRTGGISLVEPLSSGEVADITDHLSRCAVYNAHVKAKATQQVIGPASGAALRWPAFTTAMEDIVLAPHMFEAALETYSIALEYFQEPPLLYSMNAFWTHPSDEVYLDTHGWHRDGDDRKQLVFFVFGTDVMNDAEGAHYYRLGSVHLPDQMAHGCEVLRVMGPAGTAFMSDTGGMHVGARPNKLRLLLWARWGVTDAPASYHWDQLAPIAKERMGDRYPADPALQHAVRLVVR